MRSSDSDPIDLALSAAVDSILKLVAEAGSDDPVVLVDGRSGAGKTSLAARLAGAWPEMNPPFVLALDSVYPGWDGLAEGAHEVLVGVLEPRRAGQTGSYRGWNWTTGRPDELHAVPAHGPLIVEGVGVLTRKSAMLADVTVWVESPGDARKERALQRDGDVYRPHWQRWAEQEEQHLARDNPASLAQLVVYIPGA